MNAIARIRFLLGTVAFALGLLAGSWLVVAHSAVVHRCAGPDGALTLQDTPCEYSRLRRVEDLCLDIAAMLDDMEMPRPCGAPSLMPL